MIQVNKSPMGVTNPSTFSVSTNTQKNINFFSSQSPNSNLVNKLQASGKVNRDKMSTVHGGNTTSKHDPTRQTLGSDIMLPTESSAKHRDNIKQFSFKPGNLKVKSSVNVKNGSVPARNFSSNNTS